MWQFIYNLLILILFMILLPYLVLRSILKPGERQKLKERIGILPDQVKEYLRQLKDEQRKIIWIHTGSVGEVIIARAIINKLSENVANLGFIISTEGSSGLKMAKKIWGEDKTFLLPLDLPWIISKVIKEVNPGLIIIVEANLWPNFIYYAKKYKCRLILVNGRIDEADIEFKYLPRLLKEVLNKIDVISLQTETDLKNVEKIGINPKRIKLAGNIKFDQLPAPLSEERKKALRKELGISLKRDILIAGSTHPGEEKVILEVYQSVISELKNLTLIIAPRHIERADEIVKLSRQYNFEPVKRTSITPGQNEDNQVIILDTIGELGTLYSIATIVYVGGSLVEKGGHNLLEPLAYGKPVFFGPYIFNFKEIANLLLEDRIGIKIQSAEELRQGLITLIKNKDRLKEIERKAAEMLRKEQGAIEKNIDLIMKYIR